MVACGRQGSGAASKEEDSGWKLYYVNAEETKVLSVPYEVLAQDLPAQTEELLIALGNFHEGLDFIPVLSDGVRVLSWEFTGEQLSLDMSPEYGKLSPVQEVLVRAAIVRTFCQMEGVEVVTMTLEGEPLLDALGLPVGAMSSDSFISNAGNEINAYERTTLRLYFTDREGKSIHSANRTIVYNSNISLERLVAEQVIAGPGLAEQSPVVSPETKVLNATVADQTCYLNLDDAFLLQIGNVQPDVKIYAFVDSLCELKAVSRVQILVNGKSDISLSETVSLSLPFERNRDIIED